MSQFSPETIDEARKALRRLSSDVAAFRSPAVHSHLLSSTSSDPTSPAALKAEIILLRTQLDDAAQNAKSFEDMVKSTRTRAVSAEARVKELEETMHRDSTRHSQMQLEAADRIQKLEKEMQGNEERAEERESLLRDTVEKDRVGHGALVAQRDEYEGLVKKLRSKLEGMEREMKARQNRTDMDLRMMRREKEMIENRANALEKGMEHVKNTLGENRDRSATNVGKMEAEVNRLREDIQALGMEERKAKNELEDARNKMKIMETNVKQAQADKERLIRLTTEIKALRKEKTQFDEATYLSQSMAKERKEIMHLVKSLTSSGDVQEGLKVLQTAAGGALGTRNEPSNEMDIDGPSSRTSYRYTMEIENLKGEAEILRKQLSESERALELERREKERYADMNKRSERMRRMLQLEKKYFQEMLQKIEMDLGEKGAERDDVVGRLREKCDVLGRTSREYEELAKGFEKQLRKLQAEQKTRESENKESSVGNVSENALHEKVSALKVELKEARKSQKEAIISKERAHETAKNVELRMKKLEGELKQAKIEAKFKAVNEADTLDFDKSKTKVIHLVDNPLAKAMKESEAELDRAKGKKRMRLALESSTSPERDGSADLLIKELKQEVAQLSTRNADLERSSKVGIRTGEIAKKRIEEVRSAVYNLFGWTMKISGARFMVGSIYADEEEDELIFALNESGTMTLLENQYTKKLVGEIETYVQKMQSIPALLANITMDNFEKTTMI